MADGGESICRTSWRGSAKILAMTDDAATRDHFAKFAELKANLRMLHFDSHHLRASVSFRDE